MTTSAEPRYLEVRSLVIRALEAGCKRVSVTKFEWDISDDCERPYPREHFDRGTIPGTADQRVWVPEYGIPYSVLLETRCHKCRACLRARYWLWRLRAATELAEAERSWFGTLTLNPEAHYAMRCRAERRLKERSLSWDELSDDAEFVERHNEISLELTKWLKRIRKQSGAKLRYMLVAEAHKSGLPHYHVLIHQRPGEQITKRVLQGSWQLGFTSWKLTQDATNTSGYVTKYLMKEALARVRASVRYGRYEDGSPLMLPGASEASGGNGRPLGIGTNEVRSVTNDPLPLSSSAREE